MTRSIPRATLAAALVALLAVTACKKHADDNAATPASGPAAPTGDNTTPPAPATVGMPATTAPTTLTVTALDLGSSIGADNHIATPMTSFGTRDAIHASVATDGPGGTITAKWTMGDKVVDTQDKTVPAGPQVTEFSISKPDGWPTGHYLVQVSSGGNVLQSRDFEVK